MLSHFHLVHIESMGNDLQLRIMHGVRSKEFLTRAYIVLLDHYLFKAAVEGTL